jgi:hypothetical protein
VLKPLLWNTKLCCGTIRAALPKADVVLKEFLLSLDLFVTFCIKAKSLLNGF